MIDDGRNSNDMSVHVHIHIIASPEVLVSCLHLVFFLCISVNFLVIRSLFSTEEAHEYFMVVALRNRISPNCIVRRCSKIAGINLDVLLYRASAFECRIQSSSIWPQIRCAEVQDK